MGILYDDGDKILVAGVKDIKDINFKLEVSKGNYYTPIMFAAVKGSYECMKILVANMSIELDLIDNKTGCNAFWLAAYYGRGRCLSILGAAGSDIMMKHKVTNANALHIALIRGHFAIVKQLVLSNYPVNEVMNDGQTALILIAKHPKQVEIARLIIKRNVDLNQTCDQGMSALSYCIIHNNVVLADYLLRKGAQPFNSIEKELNMSAFFVGINKQCLWATEMFCDHGANVYQKSENGQNPMIYAATEGLDKICMYLSMRVNNIDMIDDRTGFNVFRIYLIRGDIKRMK